MFGKAKNATIASSSNSSVDWECDEGSQSSASTASLSYDVETEATSRLLRQLHDVESVLFGEASPKILPPGFRQEVAQWRATFPHLRICGTKPPVGPHPCDSHEGDEEEVYASHGEYENLPDAVSSPKEACEAQEQCCGGNTPPDSSAGSEANNRGLGRRLGRRLGQSNRYTATKQIELREKLRRDVLNKLFKKLHVDVVSQLQSSVPENEVPPVSASRQHEPLLASRQSAQKEISRRIQQTPQDAELGTLLRVSPLPRRQMTKPAPRAVSTSSHGSITLPPIDVQPEPSRSSTFPLRVLGRQTRLNQQKTKILR